jgi:surface antigen
VKSLTVLSRLLILTATLGSIAACSSTTPYQSSSIERPVVTPTHSGSLIVDAVNELYLTSLYGLNDTQKQKQTAAVHTALETDFGKVVHWYERDAMGAVKAVHGYPQGRGYCRVLYSLITVKGRSRELTETACRKDYERSEWYFVKK